MREYHFPRTSCQDYPNRPRSSREDKQIIKHKQKMTNLQAGKLEITELLKFQNAGGLVFIDEKMILMVVEFLIFSK
jgi:hypothetical protein